MKRSVSPQTVTDPDSAPVPKKRKFLGILSSIKTRLFSKLEDPKQTVDVSSQNNQFEPEELPVEFVSQKRRLSVHASLKNAEQGVPRMSSLLPHIKGYQELTQSLESQRDALNGAYEHERRQSIFPDGNSGYVARNDEELAFLKDISPNLDNFPRQSILPTVDRDMEYNNSDDMDEGQLQLAQPEFAPLYQDEDGNLVRPPFINLDPSERYHLLQLKRSVEMSEYLQSRLKYMVDPDETTSVPASGNKVTTTTQTHGLDEFDRKLNFNNLRTKLSTARKQRQQRTGKGFFSGEFFYEPQAPKKVKEAKQTSESLNGYLGEIQKPQFSQPKNKSASKPLPDQDAAPALDLDKNRRTDLSAMLAKGTKDEGGLDQKFLDRTASLIKMKEPANGLTAVGSLVGPSKGFNFDISKNKLGSILQTRKDDDERVDKANALAETKDPVAEANRALFGLPSTGDDSQKKKRSRDNDTDDGEKSKPSFLFGGPSKLVSGSSEDTKKADDKPASSKPAFSFDSKPSGNAKPSKLFGSSSQTDDKSEPPAKTPKFAFGSSKESESAPKFSFGKSDDKSGEDKVPKFSFGASKDSSSETAKSALDLFGKKDSSAPPLFNFGQSAKKASDESSDKKDKPQFSFASTKDSAESKPAFSFGQSLESKDKPLFSFGALDSKETPALNLGQTLDSKESKPLFGAVSSSEKPLFSFGGSSDKPSTPLFSFGEKKNNDSSTKETSFKLGDTADLAKSLQLSLGKDTPKFSFGETSKPESSSGFSFGSKPDSTKPDGETKETPKFGSAAPQFSFEKPKSEEPKAATEAPKFSFGATKSVSPSFTFGATKPADTSFGAANTSAKEATPVFSVSSKESTPKPFLFGQPAAKPAFNFGATQAPAFGTDGKSTPAFSFGKAETPPVGLQGQTGAGAAPQPAFSFGLSATADPALIFGGAKAPGPQPAAAFGNPSAGVSSTASPFNFGATQAPAFGGSGAFGGANPNPSASGFSFGAGTNLATPQPTQSLFIGQPATSSVFGSRGSTPGAPATGGFGQANPTSVFGQANPAAPGFGMNQAPATNQFNSAPGSLAAGSRENTPPVFGAQTPGAPVAPGAQGAPFGTGQLFTPPLAMKGRRIAQMRPRRR